LHHKEHYTTARDLALITRAAMQQPFFRQIVRTLDRPFVTQSGVRELWSRNKLLREFPGCTGVKTGFTNPAQHTLASSAIWGTKEMIAVVLHSTKQGKWDDCAQMLTYALSNYGNSALEKSAAAAAPRTTAIVHQ
jgi:D-alanyl-D-alanine carboxypeptidase (penicillin-binding protein 5/6)